MSILLSVVSGTYNRLPYLKKMVDSVRKSVGVGIRYEIVLVDGGSIDGTIEWAKGEDDIVLIEQGKLLGAVKAFNAGFRASAGKYVIAANDDIEFLQDSILTALVYMEENPTTGIGCFYQDRDGKAFYVDVMGALKGGVKVIVNYGQVCIIPKWLGDKVGWWGDYLYTYAGDNEMSCNVWELGYTVDPIPNAYIHDVKLEDDLRKVNTKTPNSDPNSDPQKWKRKWQQHLPDCIGPKIPDEKADPMQMNNKPRLLYAPIYEKGFEYIQKRTKYGLREALTKYFDVLEIPCNNEALMRYSDIFRPHYVLTQIHDSTMVSRRTLHHIKSGAKLINWNGDYSRSILSSDEYIRTLSMFDLALFVNANYFELYKNNGIHANYWQIGYERYDKIENPNAQKYDVVFLGNGYSAFRYELANALIGIPNIKLGIFGHWKNLRGIAAPTVNQYDFASGDLIYRNSKIAISDCQYPEATGYVSNRLFQSLYAGSFVLQQRIPSMTEYIGLEDGKHLICWDTLQDLKEKIQYWLDDSREKERNSIAKEGKKYVIAHHSFEQRALELVRMIQ